MRSLVQRLSHSECQEMLGSPIIPGPSERLSLFSTYSVLLSFPFPETAEARAIPGWAGAAARGEGRRVQPTAGAAGEEEWGSPAEHQGVSAADGARRAARGPQPALEAPPGLGETGKSPEAERG